jgi:glutathione S-transferase
MQPIIIYGHLSAPNPWKVLIILKELNVPYDHRQIDFTQTKSPPLTDINPNGRLPAIDDPNTGVKLWEVGESVL